MEVATYWIATLPSILPTAKPFAAGKQETTLVCHFNGDAIVYTSKNLIVSDPFAMEFWVGLALNAVGDQLGCKSM